MTTLPQGFVLDEEDETKRIDPALPAGFELDKNEPESRAGSMVMNGLTFGMWPRMQAAWDAGAVSGDEYEAAKKRNWAKDDAYRENSPILSFALEMGGSLPTMFIPGLNGARLAQAANQGANLATNLSRMQRARRALGFGRNVGTVGHEAGTLGAKTAALYGAGSSREDTLGGRVAEGLTHAPLGYGVGRAGDALLRPFIGASEHVADAALAGGNSELGALQYISRNMQRDGVTTQAVRDAVLPDMGGMHQIHPRAVEDALMAYGAAIDGGASNAAARSAARGAYATSAREAGSTVEASTLNKQANRALRRYATQMEIPLALDETARLAGSRGQNQQWMRRQAANTPGESQERLFESVTGRQEEIIPTIRGRVTDTMGDPDWVGAERQMRDARRAIEDQLYGASRQNEVPFDLTPALDAFRRTQAFSGGRARDATEEALRIMRGTPDMATGQYPRHTLNTYIQSRGQLNDLIKESMRVNPATGATTPTSATRQLMDLQTRMDDIVAASNPSWRTANNLTREMRSVGDAMADGMQVKLLGRDNRSARIVADVEKVRSDVARLEGLESRTPEQEARLALLRSRLEATQLGFARVLHDTLNGMGDTHTVSKAFLKGGRRAMSGPRRTLRVMMGDENAAAFLEQMERADIAGTTYKNQFNSQTAVLGKWMRDAGENSRIAGMMRAAKYFTSPNQMLGDFGEYLGERILEGKNAAVARRLSSMTDSPQEFFAMLRELDSLGTNRHQAYAGERLNLYSAPGVMAAPIEPTIDQRNDMERMQRLRRMGGR